MQIGSVETNQFEWHCTIYIQNNPVLNCYLFPVLDELFFYRCWLHFDLQSKYCLVITDQNLLYLVITVEKIGISLSIVLPRFKFFFRMYFRGKFSQMQRSYVSIQVILPFRLVWTPFYKTFKSCFFSALVFQMSAQRMRVFIWLLAGSTIVGMSYSSIWKWEMVSQSFLYYICYRNNLYILTFKTTSMLIDSSTDNARKEWNTSYFIASVHLVKLLLQTNLFTTFQMVRL